MEVCGAGGQAVGALVPLLERGLADASETVLLAALRALTRLLHRRLLPTIPATHTFLPRVLDLAAHPSALVRQVGWPSRQRDRKYNYCIEPFIVRPASPT